MTSRDGLVRPQHHAGRVAAVLCLLVCAWLLPSGGHAQTHDAPAVHAAGMDWKRAMEYCDSTALLPVEGIWEYPEDGVTVLVRRQAMRGRFDVVAVESADTRIGPGDVLGTLEGSADPSAFRLTLATRDLDDNLGRPAECLATLSKDEQSLYVKTKKRKLSLNATWILPRFWRIARLKTTDPLEKLPAGMTRLYPLPDAVIPGSPRYL